VALRNTFRLGLPGHPRWQFSLNPAVFAPSGQKVQDSSRGVDGSLSEVSISRNRPSFRLNGNYVDPDTVNALLSLMMVDHTFLIFEPYTFTDSAGVANYFRSNTEHIYPTDATHLTIPPNSYTRGSELEVAGGGSSLMVVEGVWSAPSSPSPFTSVQGKTGSGTSFGVQGYDDATRVVTIASGSLNPTYPVYVTWRAKGCAISLKALPARTEGGMGDIYTYDLELEGA